MPKSENPNPLIQNRLLAALPGKVYKRFAPELELVPLALGDVLYEAGKPVTDIYFPNEGMVSLTSTEASDAIIEIGVIGSEGMVGIAVFFRRRANAESRHRANRGQRDANLRGTI